MRTILLIMIGLSSLLSADFTRDSATGIVTDNATGLMWQDDAIGSQTTWQDAIDRCEALSLGAFEDWRLPNVNELTSLVDDTKSNPSIDAIFQNSASNYYWSSTTHANNSGDAWVVYFGNGPQHGSGKDYNYYVRCVRAGE